MMITEQNLKDGLSEIKTILPLQIDQLLVNVKNENWVDAMTSLQELNLCLTAALLSNDFLNPQIL